MHLRSSSLTARSAGGPLAATRVRGSVIETGAGFPDGYNYKTIYYINYVYTMRRFLGYVTVLFTKHYKRIPTFSRKESQHFRAKNRRIPTFSRRNPNIFAQLFESPHFRAKMTPKSTKIRVSYTWMAFFSTKELKQFLSNPHIFAQAFCRIPTFSRKAIY